MFAHNHVSLTLNMNGSYLVEYTPVVAGKYYPVVRIGGEEISTDMGGGVTVTPANASAVWSTFESSLVRICSLGGVCAMPAFKCPSTHSTRISFTSGRCAVNNRVVFLLKC